MAEKNNLKWITEFDTANAVMYIRFDANPQVYIETCLVTGLSKVIKDGAIIRAEIKAIRLNPLDEMTKLCLQVATDVETLNSFQTDENKY